MDSQAHVWLYIWRLEKDITLGENIFKTNEKYNNLL